MLYALFQVQYVLILVILVLFLHTWLTIRRLFNGKSFRWMLVSAIFLCVFSLGLSRINLIDYKLINEIILSKNINYTHLLQLPEAHVLNGGIAKIGVGLLYGLLKIKISLPMRTLLFLLSTLEDMELIMASKFHLQLEGIFLQMGSKYMGRNKVRTLCSLYSSGYKNELCEQN